MRKIVKVGEYEIHSYDALIKVTYEDGSISYDSKYGFTSEADFNESYGAWLSILNRGEALMCNNLKVVDIEVIKGIDNIRAELENETLK